MQNRIKEVARQKKIQFKTIAEGMGITYVRLHAIINQSNIETATLEKIANQLNCELIELIQPKDSNLIHHYNRDTGEYLGIIKINPQTPI